MMAYYYDYDYTPNSSGAEWVSKFFQGTVFVLVPFGVPGLVFLLFSSFYLRKGIVGGHNNLRKVQITFLEKRMSLFGA